jgi:hypothetical protein
MSKAGDIGRDAENKTRDYFIEEGYEYAKRIRLTGEYDEGDVVLGDRYPVAVEVKGGQGALKRAHSAGRELLDEIVNSGAEMGFCVIKKERSAKVEDWLVVIPMSEYIKQLKVMYPTGR